MKKVLYATIAVAMSILAIPAMAMSLDLEPPADLMIVVDDGQLSMLDHVGDIDTDQTYLTVSVIESWDMFSASAAPFESERAKMRPKDLMASASHFDLIYRPDPHTRE